MFPLALLREIESIIDPINDMINDSELRNEILEYEQLYRNHLYLSPNLWLDKVEKELNEIRVHWSFLYKDYPNALDMFEVIAPVRIISSQKIDYNSSMINLYLFHPRQLSSSEVYLLSGEEYINLDDYISTNSNWISVPIPDHWEYVDLMMSDVFIQTCPLIINESVIFTIQGDIIPLGAGQKNPIKVSIENSILWMNEINWNPYTKKLDLELAGSPNLYDQYFLFVIYQNYPNPFNGQTRISFDLLENAVVSLYITDATGRIHDKLIEEEYITSGIYNYTWDGDGRSTGIYFITLQAQIDQAPPAIFSRKMIYLK